MLRVYDHSVKRMERKLSGIEISVYNTIKRSYVKGPVTFKTLVLSIHYSFSKTSVNFKNFFYYNFIFTITQIQTGDIHVHFSITFIFLL